MLLNFKMTDMTLQTISDIVTTCLCLHNMCNIHDNELDLNWAKNAKEDMKKIIIRIIW